MQGKETLPGPLSKTFSRAPDKSGGGGGGGGGGGIEDEDNFSYYSKKTYVKTPHWNRLDEMVLMMGHKMCFYVEIWIIIPK